MLLGRNTKKNYKYFMILRIIKNNEASKFFK